MLIAGRIDDVITTLNGHLLRVPTDAESANLLCRAYLAIDDLNRAESSCKKAVALDPDNSSITDGWATFTERRRIGLIFSPPPAWLERLARNSSAPSNSTRMTS